LAEQSTATVCGMNLALIGGVLDGLKAKGVVAELAPSPGRCCVQIKPDSAR
jgi:predicted ArsR family transcriptional regulator